MINYFKTYKLIPNLRFIRLMFLSFLFIFLSNYLSNIYTSYLDSNFNTCEFVKDFEHDSSEEPEDNERETETEDSDEFYFISYSNPNFDTLFKNLHNPCILFETSNCKEVDIPPPIC